MTERAKRRHQRRKNRTLPEIAAATRAELERHTPTKYGYPRIQLTGTASVFQQALDDEMKHMRAVIAQELSEPLWSGKELRGLAAIVEGPDPLDELLAAAGVSWQTSTLTGRTVGRLGLPLAKLPNERATCKGCGIEIRLIHGNWVGPDADTACDGNLVGVDAFELNLEHEPKR